MSLSVLHMHSDGCRDPHAQPVDRLDEAVDDGGHVPLVLAGLLEGLFKLQGVHFDRKRCGLEDNLPVLRGTDGNDSVEIDPAAGRTVRIGETMVIHGMYD